MKRLHSRKGQLELLFSVVIALIIIGVLLIILFKFTAVTEKSFHVYSSYSDDFISDLSSDRNYNTYISGATAEVYNQTWLEFDGVNDYVDSLIAPSSFNTEWAINIWVKSFNHNITNEPHIFWSDSAGDNRFYLKQGTNEDDLILGLSNWNPTFIDNLTKDTWTMFTITVNNSNNAFFYRNAQLVQINNFTPDYPAVNITLGLNSNIGTNGFNGSIDSFKIYFKYLNSSDITNIYQEGRK